MPFTMPNYPSLTPEQVSPYANLIQNALAAYQTGIKSRYAQPMAEQDLQKAILANKLSGQELEWNPKVWGSEIGLRGAQAGLAGSEAAKNKFMLEHPGFMGGDEAKNIEYLKMIGIIKPNQFSGQQPATATQGAPGTPGTPGTDTSQTNPSAPFKTGNPMVDAILNKSFASAGYQQAMTQGFNWVHSPVDVKNYQVAQLAGAGIDPSASVQMLTGGLTVPQILTKYGFDPNNPPEPDFLPTTGNIKQLKMRQSALQEAKVLGDFVKDNLGPYSQTIFGMSPAQIGGAISGMDDEAQAKFLAARGLAPELNNVRLMLAQARTGKAAMQSMADKSMTDIGIYRALVKPKVWMRAQDLMTNKLEDAFSKAESVYTVGRNKDTSSKSENAETVWTRDASGKLVKE